MRRASERTESTTLIGLRFVGGDRNDDTHQHQTKRTERADERGRSALWALFLSAGAYFGCLIFVQALASW